jgi:hypothetical protein
LLSIMIFHQHFDHQFVFDIWAKLSKAKMHIQSEDIECWCNVLG